MSGGLLFIARIAVFTVVFMFVTNLARVILGSRIGILPYHVYIAGAIVLFVTAILSGKLMRLSKANACMLLWLGSLTLLIILSLLLVSSDTLAQETAKSLGLFIMMAASFTILMQNRELLSVSGYGMLTAVCLSVVISLMEFTDPEFRIVRDVLFVTDADREGAQRIGGLHVDPNANGTLMVLGLFLTQYFLPQSLRFVFALLVGAAVFTTASRGSLLLWVIVIFGSFWLGVYAKGKVMPKILGLASAVAFTLFVSTGQIPEIVRALNLEEYMNKGMVERLSSGFFTQEDGSTQSRLLVISENYEKFTEHPIIGAGLGVSLTDEFTTGSHNMLLRMASELGILGILVYLSLLIVPVIARSKEGFFFVVFFYISNMFTHTSFEKSTFAILVPFAVLYFAAQPKPVSAKRRRRRRRRVKTEKEFYG